MNKIYSFKKSVLFFVLTLVSAFAFAQPTVFYTNLTSSTSPALTNSRFSLTDLGAFRQCRFQTTAAPAPATQTYAFHIGTPAAPDYTANWRPYTLADGTGIAYTLNTVVIPGTVVNSARYNSGGGGNDGNLAALANTTYYTVNTQENAAANNLSAIWSTTFNPVTFSSVSQSPLAGSVNPGNPVTVSFTASVAPNASENVFVRYSTNGFTTSSIVQATFVTTAGTAIIPGQVSGANISYYIFSTNRTAAQLATIVADANILQAGYDMATLNLINNGGANYTYTVNAGTNPVNVTATGGTLNADYGDLNQAIAAINGGTHTGTIVCTVQDDYTETAPAGGFSITATGSLGVPITFRRSNTGTNKPVFTASSALTVGSINDAIFKIIGGDYITIDGFKIQENAANTISATAATNNMTEFGFALFYATATNGAQNNTIQNCTISLNRTYLNTFGIYSSSRTTATSMTVGADPTSTAGAISGNKIYTNAISNVNFGIVFISGSTAAFMDNGNDIGGSGAGTGNTITNFGGGAALSSYVNLTGNNYGIFSNHQINDNISFNTITSASLTNAVTIGGILKNYSVTQPTGTITTTINNNTVTITNNPSVATIGIIGINNQGLSPLLSTATMSMNNNTVQNCVLGGSTATTAGITAITNLSLPGTMNILGNSVLNNSITATTATTGSFVGISNSGAAGTVNITTNVIRGYTNNTSSSYGAGAFLGISNSGAVVTALNINSNQIGNSSGGAFTYNFASATAINNGIQNSAGASTCALSISSNSFQGFSSVSASSTGAIVSTSGFVGTSITLNNNNIGTASGGFLSFSAATSGQVLGINNAGGAASGSITITGNDIRGITHTVAGSGSHTYIGSTFSALSLNMSTNTFTNLNVNTTGSITFFSHSYSMPAAGSQTINNNSIVTAFNKGGAGGTVIISTTGASSPNGTTHSFTNNNFSNITVTGATAITGVINTDGFGTSPTKTCTGNTFSNWTGGTSAITCITYNYIGATTSSISNNTLTNITGQSTITGISIGSSFNGATTLNLASNTITNLTSTGTGGAVTGISCSNTSTTINTNNNSISTLSSTAASTVRGINISGATTNNIFKNTICDLSGSNASSTVDGILVSGSTTANIYNNRIGDLRTTAANAANPLVGLNITGGTTVNAYYNTVNLAATSSGALFGSSAISASTSPALTLNNNIFANTSTPAGAGLSVAYRRSSTTIATYGGTSNRNDFFATTIYTDATNTFTTIGTYQAFVAARDAQSISENPPFLSTTCGNSNFLKINTATPTQIESGGANVGSITDDFENDIRQGNGGYAGTGTAPDIGADEFNGSPAVAMTYVSSTTTQNTATVNANTTNQQVIGIQIVTAGSLTPLSATSFTINTNGTSLPASDITNLKIFYTGTSSTFGASNQFGTTVNTPSGPHVIGGTQVLATGTNYFWVTYDIPCTAPAGDVVDAECNSLTVVSAFTPTIQAPAGSRTIANNVLNGTYTVGSGGNFATLTAAAAAVNTSGMSGNTTFSILSSITEPGAVIFNQWVECGGGGYTLTIKPAVGQTPTISASSTTAVIVLNGADRVTIDGSNTIGGTTKDLTITNTNTGTSTAVVSLQSATVSDGATNNTIKNCIITGNASTTTLMGIFGGGTTISTSGVALTANSSNTIQNNTVSRAQYGILLIGTSTSTLDVSNTVSNNLVGTATNALGLEGIRVQNQTGATVSGNDVQNVSTATGTNVQGIYVVDTRLSNISANKIHNLIYTGGSITKIYGLSSTNTTFNTAGTPSSNTFSNNAVYDFTSNCTSTTWTLSGINNGGGYGDKYYYNTVYIATTLPATYPAAAFANGQGSIATFCTNIDVRNNILFMKASSTSASATLFAYHTTATTLAGSTFNYNDLYSVTPGVGSATYHTARFNSINYTTLANWQVVAGEANSISTDPLLNSTTNVQPQLGAPVIGAANSSGTGITTDILGVARSAGVPPAGSTMGAYENGLDGSGPSISYTVFANTISTADRTLTPVTITDPSVVNTTTFKPRLYFKKSTDANNYVGNTSGDNGWKYVETSSAGSPFDFTTAYSLLQSTVVVGDVIQYFVVAQDQASTPNVGINSGTFAATPASVALTIGAFPLTGTINSYTVTPSISGTITVPGTYPSLTLAGGAFAAINAATVVGNITIEITADLAGETGFALLEEFAAPYTITIKPTGAPRTITGTSADGLIKLNGADRVTIDGSLGSTSNTICPLSVASRDLTINNTNVAVASVVVWIKTNIANGATNNTIKNCNIVGSGNTQTLAGIFSGSSSISITSLGTGNNNNTIVNNNISRTQYGIYSQGASAANKNTGNTINQNLINTASPNNVQLGGILVGFEDNLVVSGNNIANLSTTGDVFGISAGLGSTFVTTTTVGNEVGNVLISKNILNAIASTSATGFTSIGIGVGAIPATKTADVSNNMLSNITSLATPSDYTSGITIGGGAGANNVYFNTVNMAGSLGAATASSFALAVAGTAPIPTLNIRNNILINSQTSTGVGQSYAIGLAYTSTVGNYANLVSTNNNLYTSGTSAAFAKVGSLTQGSGTNLTTLALWTAETGRDVAPLTKNVDVTFISGSNLHIDASNASNIVNLNGTAATGTGVTDDIDCDSRGSLPDIGADQFAASQVWTGITNTDYGTGTNWLTGIVPSSGDDNTIPTALTNYPVLDVDRTIGNLVLGVNTTMDINGKILTINGAVTATSTGTLTGSATSNLSLGGTAGTVYFTQTTAATRSLNDLTLSVSSSGTLGNTLDVYGTINTNSGATTGGVLNLNSQNVTLKSNTTNTARIARLKDNGSNLTGASNVTMERFIKLRTPGTGAGTGPNGRAYRLLTPTVTTTSSIKFNWMNNENNTAIGTNVNSNAPGYGTQISGSGGSANGFDKTATNQSSLYSTTNGATPTYSGVGNTSGTLNNLTGYFMYVRGDRSMDMTIPLAVGMATSSTTLRATGTLTTGPVTSFTNPLSTTIGDLNLVTNPYPSPINWTMVKSASGIGIGDAYTLWDPNKGTRGGFETVTSGGITSGGGATTSIQSGQAFFVQTATATPAVSIQETHKVAGNNNTVFLVPPETFRAKLFFNEPSGYRRMSDGVVTVYDDSYSPALDGMDAIEINNWDENIAITRSGKHLAIESRPVIAGRDTMPLFMNNMKQMNYELEFEGSHFTNPATQATLIDNFTGLRTPLSVTGITVVPITISSIAGSSSTDRFMVVFGPTAPLPVDVLTVKAYQKNGGVQVDWVVKTETNMNSYEVERSANGTQFSKSVSVASLGNTNQPRTYGWFDTNPFGGDNFYRIKSIDKAGNVKYSSIAKVNIAKGDPGITVYPNPVNGNMFNLQLNNLAKGIYVISLTNNLGQQVYSSTVQHNGGSATQTVELRNKLPGGVYDLQISGEGVKMTERLIKN